MKRLRSSPETYSIVMYRKYPSSPMSCILQTFLWLIFRANLSSFLNRSMALSLTLISGRMSFRATTSPTLRS